LAEASLTGDEAVEEAVSEAAVDEVVEIAS
jgi:hypothetical protein